MRRPRFLLASVFALTLIGPPAHAAWAPNGNPVCTAVSDQLTPVIVEDGEGGVFVAWADRRGGMFTDDIYLQRLSGAGVAQFVADGVAACAASNDQYRPRMVRDGFGGVILAWEDRRDLQGPGTEVYVQRMGPDGTPMWAANGVGLPLVSGAQGAPELVSDGQGGAIVAWEDGRLGECRLKDVYARRVDSRGTPQWAATGVPVCTAIDDQDGVRVASDGAGGAVIAWSDKRSEVRDAYAQRLNGNGVAQWSANGVLVSGAPDRQTELALVELPGGGACAAWNDWRTGSPGVFAQALSASGSPQWTANGVASSSAWSYSAPAVMADANGTWVACARNGDLYVQRFDLSGTPQWGADGVAVCTAAGTQRSPQIVSDGSGGAIVTWVDFRSVNGDIYVQRIGPAGTLAWTSNGVALCTASGDQERPAIAGDGASGAIVTWEDPRSGAVDVYAQRVSQAGEVGATTAVEPLPVASFSLAPARPNPSSGAVELRLSLPAAADARVEVFDASGRLVRVLADGVLAAGVASIHWDGRDAAGRPAPSGVYHAQAKVDGRTAVVRIERVR